MAQRNVNDDVKRPVWRAAVAVLVLGLSACGGGDDTAGDGSAEPAGGAAGVDAGESASAGDDAGVDASESASAADDAATDSAGVDADASGARSWVEIDGETFEFTNVVGCTFGDAFWGPDFRRISLDNDGDYPAISVGYAPPKADDEGVEDPNGVDVYPTVDPWWYTTDATSLDDLELSPTDDGVAGSATLGIAGDGGPDGELRATFELSCVGTAGESDDPAGDTGDTSDTSDTAAPPDVDTGTVALAGETYELVGPSRSDAMIDPDIDADPSTDAFDFEICETVNPAFEGDFNIAVNLGDGTPVRLSGNVDAEPDEDDGLFLGDVVDEERADGLDLSLDGRTLSGSATTSRGDIEFTFTC